MSKEMYYIYEGGYDVIRFDDDERISVENNEFNPRLERDYIDEETLPAGFTGIATNLENDGLE